MPRGRCWLSRASTWRMFLKIVRPSHPPPPEAAKGKSHAEREGEGRACLSGSLPPGSALWSLVYTEPGTYRAASGRTQLPSPGEHAAPPPPYRGPNPHSNQRAGGRGVSSLLRLYAYRSAFTALSLRSFLHLGSLQTSCPCGEDPGVWSCLSGPWRRLHGLQHHPELTSGFHRRHAFGKTVGFSSILS